MQKAGNLKICTWNIKRGLVKRELEIKELLKREDIDIIFLTETDIKLSSEDDYKIEGFKTVFQARESQDDVIRLICLIKNKRMSVIRIMDNIMSNSFPSIWLSYEERNKGIIKIAGFYREWSHNGDRSENSQVEQITKFSEQIEQATGNKSKVIITGDANLCENNWKKATYTHRKVASPLINCIEQCGLKINQVGLTYQADHMLANGKVPESALDHVYSSEAIKDKIKISTLKDSSTDHLPVVITYKTKSSAQKYQHQITKRNWKNVTEESWNSHLARKDWSIIDNCENANDMVSEFNNIIMESMEELAPERTFTVRSNHRFGLSGNTRILMRKRDEARQAIKTAQAAQKSVMQQKYKILRNKVTSSIRKENIDYNNKRIIKAENESELWKITNEVTNPRKENEWKIKIKEEIISDEMIIANAFNDFFVTKIQKLKDSIDKDYIEDPLKKVRTKMKPNNSKFSLKKITQKQLKKTVKRMKKKQSAGVDGLSQERLIMGAPSLISPLSSIINQSITEGCFPDDWKEAMVTPIHKKGDKQELANYRPVSCLPAASKVLEAVVCTQMSDYLESKGLLPKNQHGFRPQRSTMTAWADIQQEWVLKTEANEITGVMLWDLSAAFDTLDPGILCQKLEIYGFDNISVNWFRYFITGRSQRVKIMKDLWG